MQPLTEHIKLTDTARRALEIVRDNPGIRPREFALEMWPDNPKWEAYGKCGPTGVVQGTGMCLSGGAYLAKLRRRKLLERGGRFCNEHHLTRKGREALEGV